LKIQKLVDSLKGKSHPDKALKDHLTNCKRLAEKIKTFHNIEINTDAEILTHDIAKEHPAFQKKLERGRGHFPHAAPSANYTYITTNDLIAAETVRRHHSKFEDYQRAKNYWVSKTPESIEEEIHSITPTEKITEKEKTDLEERLDELLMKDKPEIEDWFQLRLKSSILGTADRMEAIGVNRIHFNTPEKKIGFNEYIAALTMNKLSEWRNNIRKKLLKKVNHMKKPGVYTLTLPTGAGKTLISLELAEQLKPKTIIYSLPYISIVDQNSKIASELFKKVQQDHHLSTTKTNQKEKGEALSTFIESFRYWIDPVVVTTFAALWDCLFSPKYNDTMNFHRLKDSVIILDEVQTIPPNYWEGFGKTISYLAKKLNIRILLMTATQPEIPEKKRELAGRETFPRKRHRYVYHGENKMEEIQKFIETTKPGMMVFNTRKSALKAYLKYNSILKNPIFLSKWVIPKHRLERIQKIKQLEKEGKNRTLIATQVVEAGVDIDFEWIFRDFAPLDSIVQIGGRCNRNLRKRSGTVKIAKLTDENNRSYSDYVYDKILLNTTLELIREEFDEYQAKELLKEYFKKISERKEQIGPWQSIKKGEWGHYYPLIAKRYPEATVFVDFDGSVKEHLLKLKELPKDLKNLTEKRKIWKILQQFTIEVPVKQIEIWHRTQTSFIIDDQDRTIEEFDDGIYYISPKGIGTIYHRVTGFIPPEKAGA